MPYGETTGVRALRSWKTNQARIDSKAQNMFSAEISGSVDGHEFVAMTSELDLQAAVKQNAIWRQEHTDAYCMGRDFRYAHRSRRWLLARALKSNHDQAYAQWRSFIQENRVANPTVTKLPQRDINELVKEGSSTTLPR